MIKPILTLTCLFLFVFAKAQNEGLLIQSLNNGAIDYCNGSVELGDRVGIEGDDINGGLKVSVANYIAGEDQLSFGGTAKISSSWDEGTGTLTLSGNATAAEYQDAVRSITYTNLADSPTNGTRNIAITLADVDYLPYTRHFYQYISKRGITWTEAKKEAEKRDYYGLQGYLVTILSWQENNFVWSKVEGVGWIGASDTDKEGDWVWMTGPEAGTLFWQGTYADGKRIDNHFSYWSSGEPNNVHTETNNGVGEDFAHINQSPGKEDKSWNDLRDNGDGPDSEYFYPQGYIVEFGGMKDDPEISLSAVLEINVWNIEFDQQLEKTICQNQEIRLNHEFAGNYEWFPKDHLDDPYRANPLASPMDTTVYRVVSRNGTCADSAYFTLNVKPSPIVDLGGDQNICEGDTVFLDAGEANFYEWSTGGDQRIIGTTESGNYGVRVGNQYACFAEDDVQITVHSYPEIDFAETQTLFCDQQSGEIEIGIDKGQVAWQPVSSGLVFDSPNAEMSQVRVISYGSYKTDLTVSDAYGCETVDSLQLRFYKTPTSNFSVDETECYGYNLKVNYEGDGSDDAVYHWYFLDSLYNSGVGKTNLEVSLGFESQDRRDLGLLVNEGGCLSDTTWQHINVIPNIEVKASIDDGCEPLPVNFSVETTEPVNNFIWNFGDNNTSTLKEPQNTYEEDGFYDVRLKVVSDEGCENEGLIEDMIKVRPVPSVETSIDPDSCYDHTFEVVYTGSANPQDTYHWDLSALEPDEILQAPGDRAGPFQVRLQNKPEASIGLQIVTEYNCQSENKTFSFKRKPWFSIETDIWEGCSPLDVQFSASSLDPFDQLNYSWNFDQVHGFEGGEETQSNTFYLPDHQFSISAAAESSITGCRDTAWLDNPIHVYPKPTAIFEPDILEVSIVNPEFSFSNESKDAESYYWDFGNQNGISTEFEPGYRYSELGYYEVELIAENEFLCTDSTYREVLVAFDRIFPPNALNPNSQNPENRVFLLAADGVLEEGYYFQVFNRWGERIYEVEDEFTGWDGKLKNGAFAPTGVYTWVIAYQDFLGRKHEQTGTVTLVY